MNDPSTNSVQAPTDPQALIVDRLAGLGLSAETIAYTLDEPVGKIQATLTVRTRVVDDADQELRDDARSLAQLAIRKARRILEFGAPEAQLAVVRSLLTGSTKLINTGQESGIIETKLALTELLEESRRVPSRETIVTESGIVNVPVDIADSAGAVIHPNAPRPVPALEAANDQNGETWLPET